ncbi:MAG TPA: AIR synthase family protein [Candidatus Bathyarchaeia archaeon]
MPTANEMQRFKVGKVPPSTLLRAVYPYLGRKSRSLLIGPGIGRDAAAIRYGNKVLVFSTDPITGTATHIGRHSVHINANDIATVGARPIWYLCTILLPPDADEISLRQIMVDVDNAAKGLGIAVVGGHTEVTPGLTRPIIAGFMIGETTKQGLLSSEGGREGDKVLLTKTAGLEGTAILATDYGNKLKDLEPKTLDRARKFSEQISVVKEALTAARVRGVHAMHDPTEGGVLNGLWELAKASNLGIEVDADRIPVAPETGRVCRVLGLDPLRLMSSGSLLVAADPAKAETVARALKRIPVRVSEVGRLMSASKGRYVARGPRRLKLEAVPTDELYKLA